MHYVMDEADYDKTAALVDTNTNDIAKLKGQKPSSGGGGNKPVKPVNPVKPVKPDTPVTPATRCI